MTHTPIPLDQEGFSAAFCEAVHNMDAGRLTPEVKESLMRFLIDTFGVIVAARDAEGLDKLADRLHAWETGGAATELIRGGRLSPPSAAMVNAAAAHALDFDDQHDPARVHAYCVILPTLLATAQGMAAPVSGSSFLLALAVGVELHARFGLACYNSLGKGWHPTMTFGTLAGALAAGRLLGLDERRLQDALGLAYHQAAGSAQSARDGALSKRMGPGFAARNAVTSAFLAADGISGTTRTLEGTAGLFSLYERAEVRPETLTEQLGERWHLLDYSIKPYPCCRCNHTTIGLGLDFHAQGIRAQDIVSAEILMGAVNHLTVGAPYQAERNSIVQAQFNAAYSFASAICDGEVTLRHYRRPAITAEQTVSLARRVTVGIDPEIEATDIAHAKARLTLASGEVATAQSGTIKGSPANPMSREDIVRKYHDCMHVAGVPESAADKLLAAILAIEQSVDVAGDLLAALPVQGTSPG